MSAPEPLAGDTPADAAPQPVETDVHEGRDGWLFLTAGSNNVVGQFTRSRHMTRMIEGWGRRIVERERRCRRLGVRYRHLIVPEKLTVYDHRLAGLEVAIGLSPAVRLRRRLLLFPRARRACLDTVGLFRARRDAEELYFRTDSHWSFPGCRLGYRAVCEAFGAAARDDLGTRPGVDLVHTGDLGEKLRPPRSEPARIYDFIRDAVRSYASPIVLEREAAGLATTLHVGSHVVYTNRAGGCDPRRLVLFGDSSAHFGTHGLTAMLAETFREVHFIWSSSVDWAYVERVRPDLMLTQIAERFMFRLPDDAFDTQAYAAERYRDEVREGA